jgi:hypothetical protein
MSPGWDDATAVPFAEDLVMRKTMSTKQLRELWSDAATAALFARLIAPRLVRHYGLEIGERLPRGRMSSRERRLRRSLQLGAYAVAATAAGAAAARMAGYARDVRADVPGS